jgi:hypothetical protein
VQGSADPARGAPGRNALKAATSRIPAARESGGRVSMIRTRLRHWSVRRRAIAADALAVLLFLLIIPIGLQKGDVRFSIGYAACFLGIGWLKGRLRCPKCSKLVYRNEAKVFGVRFAYRGGTRKGGLVFPRCCVRCGADLSAPPPIGTQHGTPRGNPGGTKQTAGEAGLHERSGSRSAYVWPRIYWASC